jgi:hypothetical protein
VIYSHFKGGICRKLFTARLITEAHLLSPLSVLSVVHHSDDKTRLLRAVTDVDDNARYHGLMLVDIDGERLHADEGRAALHENHVVYVSLRYGTIWARPEKEFMGNVIVGSEKIQRFTCMDGDVDTYAGALGSAVAVCKGVAREDLSGREEPLDYDEGFADGADRCASLIEQLAGAVLPRGEKS